jgi:hypothetical protein
VLVNKLDCGVYVIFSVTDYFEAKPLVIRFAGVQADAFWPTRQNTTLANPPTLSGKCQSHGNQ